MLILSRSLLRESDLLQPCQPAFSLARSDSDLQMHLPEHRLSIPVHCCPSKLCGQLRSKGREALTCMTCRCQPGQEPFNAETVSPSTQMLGLVLRIKYSPLIQCATDQSSLYNSQYNSLLQCWSLRLKV